MTLPGVHRSGQRHHRRWVTCEGVTLRLQWSRSRHQSPSGRHRAAFGLILTSAYNAVLRSTCPTGLRRAAANPSSSPHDSQHCDNGMLLDRQEHSVRMVRAPQASGHTRRRPRKIAQPTSPWLGRLWSLSEPAHEFARTRSFWRRVVPEASRTVASRGHAAHRPVASRGELLLRGRCASRAHHGPSRVRQPRGTM